MYHSTEFEEWCKSIKDDQCTMYEGLEEKSTSRYTSAFKEFTYDKSSIWKFDETKEKADNIYNEMKRMSKDLEALFPSGKYSVKYENDQVKKDDREATSQYSIKSEEAIEKEIEELKSMMEGLLKRLDTQK